MKLASWCRDSRHTGDIVLCALKEVRVCKHCKQRWEGGFGERTEGGFWWMAQEAWVFSEER